MSQYFPVEFESIYKFMNFKIKKVTILRDKNGSDMIEFQTDLPDTPLGPTNFLIRVAANSAERWLWEAFNLTEQEYELISV